MAEEIRFDDTIINFFVNGPTDFTRYEEHDIAYLTTLLNDPNVSESDIKILAFAIKKADEITDMSENGMKALPYQYYPDSGRYAAKLPLFGLSKNLKDDVYFLHDGYKNLDIVNRNFTIFDGIAQLNDVKLPTIKKFVDNYKDYYGILVNYFNKESVKSELADLVYHPKHKEGEKEFIKDLVDDLQKVHEIFKHPTFTVMQVVEVYSTFIIHSVYEYLVKKEIIKNEHCVLGNNIILFRPLKSFDKEDIERYVSGKTKFNVKFH
uniref:Uncharacterized protein n=1 Tax=Panagrolaimus sp. PS1159 TaxID=55785 RepID=A0AC35FFT7_9BILA